MHPFDYGPVAVLVPFAAIAGLVVALGVVQSRIDAFVQRTTHHRRVTPYSTLAAAATRIREGSLEHALPGLAEVLADGTGATRAAVWIAIGDRLDRAADYPRSTRIAGPSPTLPNLAVLLDRDDTDYVVPVLDGTTPRAALAIGKPGAAITPDDQTLVRDVARGAALLLRAVSQNAKLSDQVRRADALAGELEASRLRLAQAREVERRRLVVELRRATDEQLATLSKAVAMARANLEQTDDTVAVGETLRQARVSLDATLDRLRVIARGVYPAMLRDQGPVAAVEEVINDLPRPVQVSEGLGGRLPWEIESGVYFLLAAAVNLLAARPAPAELQVNLERADRQIVMRVFDPTPVVTVEQLRAGLAVEGERLATLGGSLELTGRDTADGRPREPIVVLARLPDRLEPLVEGRAS